MGEPKQVRLVKINWNEECELDLLTGRGFEVTDKSYKTVKGREEKTMNGIHSPRFATDWDDENAFAERYSCKCKSLVGRVYEGEVCPDCGTEVKFRDVDLKVFGWIRFNKYAVIQPIFYKMLETVIGKKIFAEIIEYSTDIDKDGNEHAKQGKNPFKGIGMIAFRERFHEVIDYFKGKKKNVSEVVAELLADPDAVFVTCLPVYSSILRPVAFKGESFFYNKIDKKYNSIFSTSRLLHDVAEEIDIVVTKKKKKKRSQMDKDKVLHSLQQKINELWDLIFAQINQKEGHIRDQILGGRLNFSARNVIIPDPSLKADEIRLGYLTFLELFKYEIIAHITTVSNVTPAQAFDEWNWATVKFDAKIYEIMMYLIKRKPKVIINRNPTINYGSLLLMTIVDIKREYDNDYTMSLPIQVLTALNADFDGDILNIISLKTREISDAFEKAYNPRKNMFISRNDGKFNNDFNLLKDQMIGLWQFNNI